MWDEDISHWRSALSNYSAALLHRQAQANKSRLSYFDKFVWERLPQYIRSREPNHLNAAEYIKLIKWKLKRGKWRPRLLAFANSLTDSQLKTVSSEAYELLQNDDMIGAMKRFCELRGCGPATASALVALMDENVPFMGDEVLIMTQGPRKSYTIKAFERLATDLKEKSWELSKADTERDWTARDVEWAVFANDQLKGIPASEIEELKKAVELESEDSSVENDNAASFVYNKQDSANKKSSDEKSSSTAANGDSGEKESASTGGEETSDIGVGTRRSKRRRIIAAKVEVQRRTSNRKKRKVS